MTAALGKSGKQPGMDAGGGRVADGRRRRRDVAGGACLPGPAAHYPAKSQPVFFTDGAEAWESALAHAVAANVAAAQKDAAAHREHYATALELVAKLPDPEDRKILEATLRVLPSPGNASA